MAGADAPATTSMQVFGIHMGRAFQIHDDIQGIWGDTERTGKEPAGDLLNRKKTLPTILASTKAGLQDRKLLDAFFAHETDDIDGVITAFNRLGVRQMAAARAAEELSTAASALVAAGLGSEGCRTLQNIAEELAG